MVHKHLFLLDMTMTGTATDSTTDIHLSPPNDHIINRDTTEVMPFGILNYVIITSDLATARTITVCLHTKSRGTWIKLYDVTPDCDNNTIYMKPCMNAGALATANVSETVGVMKYDCFFGTQHTYIRFVASGALGDGETQRFLIMYEGYEKVKVSWGGVEEIYTIHEHMDLGVFEGLQQ